MNKFSFGRPNLLGKRGIDETARMWARIDHRAAVREAIAANRPFSPLA